jgi:hypothetical protein
MEFLGWQDRSLIGKTQAQSIARGFWPRIQWRGEAGGGEDDGIQGEGQDLMSRRLGTSILYITDINLNRWTVFIHPVGAGLISSTGIGSVMKRKD